MAKIDPDLPTIEELEKLVSKRVPLPGDDLLVKIGDFSIAQRYRQMKYGLVGLIAICLVGGGLSVLALLSHKSPVQLLKPTKKEIKVAGLSGGGVQNDIQLYRQASADPAMSTYSLLDKAGSRVGQATQTSSLQLVASLSDDKLLMSESTGAGLKYSILSAEGHKSLDTVPTSLTATAGDKRANAVTGFDASRVVYQYCDNDDLSVYNCDLRTFDVDSGKEAVLPFSAEVRSYRPRLLTFSNDRRSAYLIGMTEADRQSLKAKILNAGNNSAELNKLQYDQRIIKINLATQAVESDRKVETQYNRSSKYWLSPNGRYLIYSAQGLNGALDYVDLNNGTAAKLKLPADDDTTQPWSGATATADPRFSQDGRYMAYVTYGTKFSNKLESLGLIDLQTRGVRELAKQPNDGTGVTNYFSNLQWRGQQLDFRAGRDNQRFDLSTSTIQSVGNDFGLLLASADNAN